MARGYPDYNNPFYAIASASVDFSQVIALASGIVPVDNLGRMITGEAFREGIENWSRYMTTADVTIEANTQHCEFPPACCLVNFAGLSAVDYGYLKRLYATTMIPVWGIEYSLAAANLEKSVTAWIEQASGLSGYKFSLRVNTNSHVVQYYNGTSWVTVGPAYFNNDPWIYQTIKMVVDFQAGTLKRVIIGDSRYDFDIPAGEVTAYGGAVYYTEAGLLVEEIAGSGGEVRIGHAYITIEEP